VCDWAVVYGEVNISPLHICGTRHWICWSGSELVSSGCITKPISWWLANVERCAEEHGYSAQEQDEYLLHMEHMHRWMKLYDLVKR
jgi:hypothetical protein